MNGLHQEPGIRLVCILCVLSLCSVYQELSAKAVGRRERSLSKGLERSACSPSASGHPSGLQLLSDELESGESAFVRCPSLEHALHRPVLRGLSTCAAVLSLVLHRP